jgi:hypothetical protein
MRRFPIVLTPCRWLESDAKSRSPLCRPVRAGQGTLFLTIFKKSEVSFMRHSLVWSLVLLVFWAVPGCSSTEPKHTATIVITEGNAFLFKTVEGDSITYLAGDSVRVEWENDTCYVNGHLHQPRPPQPPKVFPVETIRQFYGTVPSVLEYVRTHSGNETDLWNRAYRQWEAQMGVLVGKVLEQYASDLKRGKTPDAAADSAEITLRKSPLVGLAHVDENTRWSGSRIREVRVQWAGESDTTVIELRSKVTKPRLNQPPMTLEEFKGLVLTLRLLESKGPVTVELTGGKLNVISGPDALEWRWKR